MERLAPVLPVTASAEAPSSAGLPRDGILQSRRSYLPIHTHFIIKEVAKLPAIQRYAGEKAALAVIRSGRLTRAVLRTREWRLAAERQSPQPEHGFIYYTVKTAVEIIPGAGDLIVGYEAVRGREWLGGRKLDRVDRTISAIAMLPFLPATPFREGVRNFRRALEETVAESVQTKVPENPPSSS